MSKTRKLVECAVLVALAFILSLISVIKMPFGGEITAACMFPIIIAAYRNGLGWGIISAFAFSLLQLLTGLKNVGYATSATAAVAIILLDYIIAFTVIGLIGIWKRNARQNTVLVFGTIGVCILRYLCHVISGATVWAGLSIPTKEALVYSLVYNMAYMVPELVITIFVTAWISNSLNLREDSIKTRLKSSKLEKVLYSIWPTVLAILVDFIYLFFVVQTEEGFDITRITTSKPSVLIWVTAGGIALSLYTYFIMTLAGMKSKKNN